jgi:hypothetical protein
MSSKQFGGRVRGLISDGSPIEAYRQELAKRQVNAMLSLARSAARKVARQFQIQGIGCDDCLVESNFYLNGILKKHGVNAMLLDYSRKVVREKMKEAQ